VNEPARRSLPLRPPHSTTIAGNCVGSCFSPREWLENVLSEEMTNDESMTKSEWRSPNGEVCRVPTFVNFATIFLLIDFEQLL
jgi:hypothetical protein